MKKRITSLVLAISIFSAMSAYAEPGIKTDGGKITVTAVIEPFSKATMFVVRADASIDDDSNVYAMRQATADENGKVNFSFGIPEEKNSLSTAGEYKVYIKQTEVEMQTGSFFYAPVEKRDEMIFEIKSGNVESVLNNKENEIALKALGIEMDLYKNLDEKASVISMAEEIMKNASSDSDYSDAVNYAILVHYLNEDNEESDTYISKLGLSFENTDFEDINDEKLRSFIISYIYSGRDYNSYDAVKNSYNEANILHIINNTRYTAMEKTLKKYAESLGISSSSEYDDYLDISSVNREKADKKIVEKLKSSPAENVDDLLDVIDDAVASVEKKSSGGGGGSSGGGGGSSISSNISSVPGVSVAVPSEAENKVYFSDLSGVKWAEDAIYALAGKGIVSGDGDGRFYPDRALTREEFVKMLVVASEMHDKNSKCEFTDVTEDKWYYTYIASAFENKLVNGISETEFGVGRMLSRQDMAVMCNRGISKIKKLEPIREYINFADEKSIRNYALEDVKALYEAGIINGVDSENFEPEGKATRAQAAVIIYNLFK